MERSSTSEDAISIISEIIEKYGSHKSGTEVPIICLLIGDIKSVYIMDIIGKIWACEQLTTNRSLAAGVSIGKKFDKVSDNFRNYLVSSGLWNENVS